MKKTLLASLMALTAFGGAWAQEFSDPTVTDLWVMGAVESGWNMGGTKMEKVADDLFEMQVILLEGDFKFCYEEGNWSAWIYATEANTPVVLGKAMPMSFTSTDDYKWLSDLQGAYKLSVDTKAMTLTVTEAEEIYLIGDATPGGWNLSQAIALKKTDSQTYTGQATLGTGEFKFLASNKNFSSSVVSPTGVDMTLGTPMKACYENDNKWNCTEAGAYSFSVVLGATPTVTVNTAAGAFIPTEVCVVSGSSVTPATGVATGIFKLCSNFAEGTTFKVQAKEGNTTKWVKAGSDNAYTYVDTEAEATTFSAAGEYRLVVNGMQQTVTLEAYTEWTELYITGSFNGWSFDAFTPQGNGVFTWEGDINVEYGGSQEVKFMGKANFDSPEFDLHPYVSNQLLADALYCYNGGNDNKWLVAESAHFVISVNTFEQTVKVATSESGVKAVTAAGVAVRAADRTVSVSSPEAVRVVLYDLAGRIVAAATGADVSLQAPAHGLYVVKAGDKVVKISL